MPYVAANSNKIAEKNLMILEFYSFVAA